MTIYVDCARNQLGRMMMCHLLSNSLSELHQFAERIGLKREWFQLSRSGVPHYDIPLFRRQMAIEIGAIELDRRATARLCAWWRTQGSDP